MSKLVVLLVVLSSFFSLGQESVDFGPAFEALWSLGLPQFTNGVLVKAEVVVNDSERRRSRYRYYDNGRISGVWPSLPGQRKEPKATSWLISSNLNGRVTLLGAYGDVVEGYDCSVVTNVPAGEKLKLYKIERCVVSNDLQIIEKSLAGIIKKLKKNGGGFSDDPFMSSSMMSHHSSGIDQRKSLFAFAALYKSGYKSEANRVMRMLLKTTSDPEKVVKGAMTVLAFRQYSTLVGELQSMDLGLKGYVSGLDIILNRYGKHWAWSEAVTDIRDDCQESIALKSTPRIKELNEENQRLATALVEGFSHTNKFEKEIFELYSEINYDWLFDSEAASRHKGTSVLVDIVAGGINSIPMLAAMCGDRTVTGLIRDERDSIYRYDEISSKMLGNRDLTRLIISRPVTRSEFAMIMLDRILPVNDKSEPRIVQWVSAGTNQCGIVREVALDFYNKNRNMVLLDLAWSRLGKGNSFSDSAYSFLLRKSEENPGVRSRLEKTLLENTSLSDDPFGYSYDTLNPVMRYCDVHGEATSNLVMQVGKKLNLEKPEEGAEEKSGDGGMYSGKGGRDDYARKQLMRQYAALKKLVMKVEEQRPETLDDIAEEWCRSGFKGEGYYNDNSIYKDLARISKEKGLSNTYGALLDMTIGHKDADGRLKVIGLISPLQHVRDLPEIVDEETEDESEDKDERVLSDFERRIVAHLDKKSTKPVVRKKINSQYKIEQHKERWRVLLSDERTSSNKRYHDRGVAESVARLLCGIAFEGNEDISNLYSLPNKRQFRWYKKGAEHALSGKKSNEFKWPVIENLDDAGIEDFVGRLKRVKQDKIVKFIDEDISDNEYLCLREVMENHQELDTVVAPYAAMIRKVNVAAGLSVNVSNSLNRIDGEMISVGLIKKFHDTVFSGEKGGFKDIEIRFYRGDNLAGWQVNTEVQEEDGYSFARDRFSTEIEEKGADKVPIFVLSFTYRNQRYVYSWGKEGKLSLKYGDEFAGIKGETTGDALKMLNDIFSGKSGMKDGEEDEEYDRITDRYSFEINIF